MDLLHKEDSYQIIGACMEVHRHLGKGHSEVLYGDALEVELNLRGVKYKREVNYKVKYKGIVLTHHYYADFVVENKIILELKALKELTSGHVKQTLNYLAASELELGILVNFGEDSLKYRRIVL